MAGVEEEAVELFYSVKVSPDSPCALLRNSKLSASTFKLLKVALAGVEEEVAERVEPVKLRHQPERVLFKALGPQAGAPEQVPEQVLLGILASTQGGVRH